MALATLEVRKRALQKKSSRFLRRAGITPANLYGAGIESLPLQVDTKALLKTISTTVRNTPVELRIAGESQPRTAFIWSIQRDPLTENLVHVDFYHVEATRRMRATVPVTLVNVDPLLERLKLRVTRLVSALEVECFPGDLPPSVTVDAAKLQALNDSIAASALRLGDRVTVLTPAEATVAKVLPIIEVKEIVEAVAAEAAAPAEGEVAAAPAEGEAAPAEAGEKPKGKAKAEPKAEGEKKK